MKKFITEFNQNFLSGVRNARKILDRLELSIKKTNRYEDEMLLCRASHSHSHVTNTEWNSEFSIKSSSPSNYCDNEVVKAIPDIPRSQLVFRRSWSAMSLVCLKFQYEELSKRFQDLQKDYKERGSTLKSREAILQKLQLRVQRLHARIAHAHNTVLVIGQKYLALKEKRLLDKNHYEHIVEVLQSTVVKVMELAERARAELNAIITHSTDVENSCSNFLMLAEIRKCNVLCEENIRLKTRLQELTEMSVGKAIVNN